jgi:isopentenyl-diphosphate delta-isomerase
MTVDARSRPTTDDVVLLDDDGTPRGTAPRLAVHDTATPLHLAFSVHLIDPEGRTLITRRALHKSTWPGVWTNSCCGHPRPGEPVLDAVRRRTGEELGIELPEPTVVLPDFRYRAVDAGGIVENEICPVHVAAVDAATPVHPDPAEVAEVAWVPWADLHASVTRTPVVFSPWIVLQVRALGPEVPLPLAERG